MKPLHLCGMTILGVAQFCMAGGRGGLFYFQLDGSSGDSEELKTLKTLTAVSGDGGAKENKWKVLFSCCQKFDILLCMWFPISLSTYPPNTCIFSPSRLFLSWLIHIFFWFIVWLIARLLVALTLVKIFAWACGKRRMIDDIAEGNSNQLLCLSLSFYRLSVYLCLFVCLCLFLCLCQMADILSIRQVQGNSKEKLEIMLPEIKENALALTSHQPQ